VTQQRNTLVLLAHVFKVLPERNLGLIADIRLNHRPRLQRLFARRPALALLLKAFALLQVDSISIPVDDDILAAGDHARLVRPVRLAARSERLSP
jgi:hypothetical protein